MAHWWLGICHIYYVGGCGGRECRCRGRVGCMTAGCHQKAVKQEQALKRSATMVGCFFCKVFFRG
jgi:hypothetical protein